MKKCVLVIMLLVLLGTIGSAEAASVTLTWESPTTNEDGSPLTDLAGFNLYRGQASGNYTESVDVGLVNIYLWNVGDVEGQTWYFNATAYDDKGNESAYNGEVRIPFPMVAPGPVLNLTGAVATP